MISAGTGADDKDPDTVVVSIAAPWSAGLPAKEMYEDEKIVKSYERTISEVFSALRSHAALQEADTQTLVEFEKRLAAATPSAEDRNDVTVSCLPHGSTSILIPWQKYYNPMSLKDAEALAPELKLSGVLGDLVPSKYKLDRLIVMSPDYLKLLGDILSTTPQEILHTYFLWKTIQTFSSYIEADAVAPIDRFRNELSGQVGVL